jgi:hypothetical protein
MVIAINPAVITNAGADQTVCASSPNVTLAGTIVGGATTGTWSGGTGTYNPNNTTLNAIYTPSAAEITAGTVTLTLTSADPAILPLLFLQVQVKQYVLIQMRQWLVHLAVAQHQQPGQQVEQDLSIIIQLLLCILLVRLISMQDLLH